MDYKYTQFYHYSSEDFTILNICSNEYNYFFNKANVQGIGLGFKTKNGFCTYKKCIKVFVTKKIPTYKLPPNELIPSLYKGIQTDIVEAGIMNICSLNSKVRPVTGGYNIGSNINYSNGTFGCLVTDGKYYYVLSNNHILASENSNPIGTDILQPSHINEGLAPNDTIAHLSKYIKIYYISILSKPENFVDCAMAKIYKRSLVSTKITFVGHIKGKSLPILNEDVQKIGCTSELTKGKITALGATYTIHFHKGTCLFKDQIITTRMIYPGDSGSILLDKTIHALGMTISSSTTVSIFNPIDTILNKLNVTLVTR